MKVTSSTALALGFLLTLGLTGRAADTPANSGPDTNAAPAAASATSSASSTAAGQSAATAPLATTTNATSGLATNTTSSPVATTNTVVASGTATTTPAASPTNTAAGASSSQVTGGFQVTDHNIRFQFDGIPYSEVVTRFSQMAKKPLISDTKVDGTLTFNDPRPYTYAEALETLNLVLAMKGVMLVETDRYLRLVQLKDLQQMPLRIFRGLDKTGDVRPGEVVTVVLNLQNLDAAEISQSITAMLSNAGSVAPLSRGRGMIITDRLGNIKRIRDLLTEIDTASPVQRQMKTYTLLNASGVVLTDLINRTFGVATAPRRVEFNQQTKQYHQLPADPNDYVTAIYDDASRTLVLFGPADRISLAETLIKRFDERQGGQAGELRVFYPTSISALELARMIRQAIPGVASDGEPPASMATKARLIVDPATNRLIVTAPVASQLDDIADFVKKIDVPVAKGETPNRFQEVMVTKIVRCRTADPNSLMRILSDVFQRPRFRDPSRTFPSVRITIEPKTRSLVLFGNTGEVDQALELIKQLDSDQPAKRTLRILTIKSGRSSDFALRIRQLYLDQIKGQPDAASSEALILGDDRSNRLVVTATEDHMKIIEDLVQKLDTPLDLSGRELKTIALKHTSAGAAASIISQLYARQFRLDDPNLRVFVTASPDDQTLVIEATSITMKKIEDLLKTLDAEAPEPPFEVRTYKLTGSSVDDLVQTLSRLFTERQGRRRGGGEEPRQPHFEADRTTSTLIVAATKDQFPQIEALIKELRASFEVATEIRTFKLEHSTAEDMTQLLETMLSDDGNSRQNRPYWYYYLRGGSADANKLRITPAPALNAVVIQGRPEKLALAEQLIKTLDQPQTGTSGRQLKVIAIKHSSATAVAGMLQQLFARQSSSDDPNLRVRVSAAPNDQAIVVEATANTFKRIEEVVQSLDMEATEGPFDVRTYHLDGANVDDLAQTLARIFAERQDGRRRDSAVTPMQPRFEADTTSGTLIVAATKDQFPQIEQLIKDLRSSVEVAMEIRTFKLQYSTADEMVQLLQTMLSDDGSSGGSRRNRPWYYYYMRSTMPDSKLRITAAPTLNAVVVQGPPQKLSLAEQLIRALDKPETDTASTLQSVHLRKGTADSVAQAVNQALAARGPNRPKRVSVTPVSTSDSVLIDGPANEVKEVLKIIQDLDKDSASGEIEIHIYKLENGKARDLSQVLMRILQGMPRLRGRGGQGAQVTVAADDRSNSLIVTGTAESFKWIEQMLPTLDHAPERLDRVVNYFWLANADAFDVASKIEAMYADRPKDQQVTVEPELSVNAVSVVARKSDLPEIEDLIKRLDEAALTTSLQVRLVPLDKVPAPQMAEMLQNIYSQMSRAHVQVVEKLPPPPAHEPGATPPGRARATNAVPVSTSSPQATTTNRLAAAQVIGEKPVPEVVIAVDKKANALILSGPARELDNLYSIIIDLSTSAVSNEDEFRQFPLQEADPVAVARTLNQLLQPVPVSVVPGGAPQGRRGQRQGQGQPQQPQGQPNVVMQPPRIAIVAEPRTRSIIVRAKPKDFSLLETLVKQLDVAGLSSQLSFRLVGLTNVTSDKLLPLIDQMIRQLNLARPGEPVTVTRDPRGGALFVVARNTLLDQIEHIIHELDTPGSFAEAVVSLIPLKNAQAPQLAAVLQEMLKPGTRGEVTTEARELQEQVRRLRVENEQGEPVLLDLTKPIKIMADPIQGAAGGSNRLILTSTSDNLKALSAIVAMMDTVPLMEGITAKLVHLKYADATTVAQTLNSVFQQGQRLFGGPGGQGRAGGRLGRGLNSPLNVAVDRGSNTLILSGQEESMALAQTMIDQLDRQSDSLVTEIRLIALKYASATHLAPLLQSVFAEGRAVGGTDGLRSQVSRLKTVLGRVPSKTTDQAQVRPGVLIQADDAANILVIAARNDTMPLIEDVIHTLDVPEASGVANIRIYPLEHADALTMQQLINDLFRGNGSSQVRKEDRPNVTIDDRTNALIVSGNNNSFAIIASLLERLDKELPTALRDVHIIPLENADSLTIAASLQRLVDARMRQRGTQGKQETIVVIGDPRTNCLLVGGNKEGFDLVRSLVTELDKISPALIGQVRLVPLKHATAQTLSAALNALFSQRYQAARSPDLQRSRPIIIPDPRSNSLLVAATVEDNRALDVLLGKLDREPENPSIILTVIGLRHNDAAQVSSMIGNVFTARRQAMATTGVPPSPQDQVHLEADPLTNSLLISASPENLELIRGLLAKVDVEPAGFEGVIQMFPLKQADAQRAANMLRSLIQQGLYRPGAMTGGGRQTSRDAIAVAVDPLSNTLIISASPENLAVVKELIKQIDSKANADAGDIQLFSLKHARASQLAAVLQQFFLAKRASEAVGGPGQRSVPVTVTPDDRTNTLLVTGGRDAFAAIERMVAQLDAKDILSQTSFRVFPLKQATAAKLQATLTQLFLRRPALIQGQAPQPISVVADSWANALIIGAAPEDMSMVESVIQQLDSDHTTPGMEVQVLPLAKADARRVAQTLNSLYSPGGPGAAAPVTVNVDERVNAVVVSAGQADMKRIAELVKKLDTDQVATVSEIRIFGLTNARATQLAAILTAILNSKPTPLTDQSTSRQSLLQFITRTPEGKELLASALKEGILITPDPRTNSLIVSAPLDYMKLLEQLINKLDSTPPQMAKIRVFNLKNADARQMSTILQNMFRLQPIGGQAINPNNRSIQYTLVKPIGMDNGADGDDPEDEAATIGNAEDSALTLNVDVRSNSLIVGGTDHYIALAGQIIESLDSSPAQERESEVYRLKNSRAPDIQLALQNFTRQDQQLMTAAYGQQAFAQELLDRAIDIVAETNSNTLLISASPRYLKQVRAIIEQLDQPQLQVLIQVLLAEVSLDEGDDLGVEWNYHSGGNPSTSTGTDFGLPQLLKNSGGFSSAVSGNNFSFLFRALQTEGRLQVLSRPQILTGDNMQARINVSQQVPLVTGSSTVGLTGNINNTFQYQDVGVILTVTPRISPDGFVKMDITTTNSQVSSSTAAISPGFNAPIINVRSAMTSVSVQSGQSILIGGLISTTDNNTVKRMPILGSIPGLGALFRSTIKTVNRTELLILMTPQVLLQPKGETGRMGDARSITREQLEKSAIHENFRNDVLQRQILEPLFPTNHVAPGQPTNKPSLPQPK